MDNYEVQIYYSGFCTYKVAATNESEAIQKARKMEINANELLRNAEPWEDADTAEKV